MLKFYKSQYDVWYNGLNSYSLVKIEKLYGKENMLFGQFIQNNKYEIEYRYDIITIINKKLKRKLKYQNIIND